MKRRMYTGQEDSLVYNIPPRLLFAGGISKSYGRS